MHRHGGCNPKWRKKQVSEQEFLRLLNEELMRHPEYEEGMRFVPPPADLDGPSMAGYFWEDDKNRMHVFIEVARKVMTTYAAAP
jgi:hypothetical protein